MRRAVEQGKLAEEVTGAQGGDDCFLAIRRWQDNLHRPGAHHVERVPWIALVEDDLVTPESAPCHGPCQNLQPRRLNVGEEGALLQAVDREFFVEHLADQLLIVKWRRSICRP